MNNKKRTKIILFFILISIVIGVIFYFVPIFFSTYIEYNSTEKINKTSTTLLKKNNIKTVKKTIKPIITSVTHIKTPSVVKAIYISSWVAGTKKYMNNLINLADDTEINAMVIDIKDSSGRISFNILNKDIQKIGSFQNRISNIRELLNLLHKKNIYVIGRVAVFQDKFLAKNKPEWAIKRSSDGKPWKDYKGMSFLDPTNLDVQKYILNIALGSYKEGFDEINFDYIRYPSDGNISDIDYKLKAGQTRSDNIENFFKFLSINIKKENNIPISADLFGLTTEVKNDMGIGQIWEKAVPYFDFVAPMLYPSHYGKGHLGYKNPSEYPYEIVLNSMSNAVNRTKAINQNINKIRPWLQDFNLGATYTKDKIKAQIKAVNDLGVYSWMLWSPSNKYTKDALKLENS